MADDSRVFQGTKHHGKTFASVRRDDPGYLNWAKSLDSPSGILKDFLDYCRSKDDEEGITKAWSINRSQPSPSPHLAASLSPSSCSLVHPCELAAFKRCPRLC